MYTSLAATSETLRHLIEDAMKNDVGPGGLANLFTAGGMTVSLATPQEITSGKGVSLWLYRVARDENRLNDPPTLRPLPGGGMEVVPPPLPMRLQYLVTPLLTGNPDSEQRILGRVLQLFHEQPSISGAALRSDLSGTDAEVHVRLEGLSLEEITRVWDALEGSYQLSVSYEVTLANIASTVSAARTRIVESTQARHAVVVGGGV
jgi:hypothetical protein